MAGAGYKLFNTGDVLTAAQVNTYLQEQTVMVFASAAARTTALSGVLAEGMITYLKDTDAVEKYTGAAWVSVGGSSPLTTKGDLYTYSTADARLPVGTNGQYLSADSTAATGLKWVTPSTGGGYTLLTSGAFSGTTLSITSIPSTYKELVIFLDGYDPTDDGDNMRMRFNQDSTANRHYASLLTNYVDTQAFNATSVDICRANDNTVITNNIVVRIPNYATTAGWKRGEAYSITVSETTTTSMRAAWYALYYNQTTAISSLDFVTSGANTFAVNYKVYGVT